MTFAEDFFFEFFAIPLEWRVPKWTVLNYDRTESQRILAPLYMGKMKTLWKRWPCWGSQSGRVSVYTTLVFCYIIYGKFTQTRVGVIMRTKSSSRQTGLLLQVCQGVLCISRETSLWWRTCASPPPSSFVCLPDSFMLHATVEQASRTKRPAWELRELMWLL